MKINDSLNVPGGYELNPVGDAGSSEPKTKPQKAGGSDDAASFSVDGGKLKTLEASLNDLPEVRQKKVEQLQQAIQDGTYRVTDHDIAGAVLSDLLGWPGETR